MSIKSKEDLAKEIKDEVAQTIFDLEGIRPNVAIILLGEDHEYLSDLKALEKEAAEVGVDTHLYVCDIDSPEEELSDIIKLLNEDDLIDAIYIQNPIPQHIDAENLFDLVRAEKQINIDDDLSIIDQDIFEAQFFKNVLANYKERNLSINEQI